MTGLAAAAGGSLHRSWTWLFVTILAVTLGSSWLLVVFLLDGRGTLEALKLRLQSARTVQLQTVVGVLARSASLSPHVDVTAVYATREFFDRVQQGGRALPYSPETATVFVINEDTHHVDLDYAPTPAVLRVDGQRVDRPVTAETMTYSIHHKVSVLTFPHEERGRTRSLELLIPRPDGGDPVALRWDLPLVYPPDALRGRAMSLPTMVAFAAGLLASVLTPCLIQLVVFYLSTLTGFSAERLSAGALTGRERRRVLTVALGFVTGFTALFTGVGALAGFAGQTLQNSDLWATWTRPAAVTAGVVIILAGLWMAARARAPLVCRLPLARLAVARDGGILRSMVMGLSFAIGCATCFGGALIATLLLYVGTLGSATEGALVLFLFSLGVDLPFLGAALLLSRVLPLLQRLDRTARGLAMASGAIMVGFGLLLITDNFHRVSNWVYLWLLS